jgi:DNA primase
MDSYLSDLISQCHQNLLDSDKDDPFGGYFYLRGRGVSDFQIDQFNIGLGYSNVKGDSKFNYVFNGSLKNYIVVPLYNASGKLRGLETRTFDDTKKYVQFYLDGWKEDAVCLGFPYTLESIWESETVFLVEGMFDFFPLQRIFPNVLSPLSAKVTPTQNRFLQRFCKNVVYMFDMDTKGDETSKDLISKSNIYGYKGYKSHRFKFPAKDIGEMYDKMGYDRLKKFIESEVNKLNLYL